MLYRLYTPDDFDPLYAIEEVCFQPPFRFGRRYMRKLIDSPSAAQEVGGINAYIPTIEVVPEWRGRGVGGELLRRVEDSARGALAQWIWLHVDAENAAAIRLYEANGYRNEGREEDFYSLGRAGLIYGKPLEAVT
jgi:ribosomal protein S18 acetylase RimI-like enzyme